MSVIFALDILADLCYYMFAVASLATLAPHSGLLITSPLIVAAAAGLARFCARKWRTWRGIRYAPIILCALCFAFTRTAADIVVTAPMIIYLGFVLFKNNLEISYESLQSRFFLCLKLILAPVFFVLISSNLRGFIDVMLPYMFFYLILSVMLLRMLRHNDRVLTDRRFLMMNLVEIGVLCGIGYLLSSGIMMSVLRFLGNAAIKYIFRPLLTLLVYILGGVAWLLNKVFGNINLFDEEIDVSGLEGLGTGMDEGEKAIWEFYEEATSAESAAASQAITYVAIGVGALVLIILVVLLFRALMASGRRRADNQFADERVDLDKDDSRAARLGHSPRDRVRQYYRKFLKMCYRAGMDPDENLNSREINDQVRNRFDRPALAGLRDVYIRARYSSSQITSDDVKAAKNAYEALKKSEQ